MVVHSSAHQHSKRNGSRSRWTSPHESSSSPPRAPQTRRDRRSCTTRALTTRRRPVRTRCRSSGDHPPTSAPGAGSRTPPSHSRTPRFPLLCVFRRTHDGGTLGTPDAHPGRSTRPRGGSTGRATRRPRRGAAAAGSGGAPWVGADGQLTHVRRPHAARALVAQPPGPAG